MKTQKMDLFKPLFIVFAIIGLLTFQSCSGDYFIDGVENTPIEVETEDLRDLSASDLENMKEILKAAGVDIVDEIDIYANQSSSGENSPYNKAPSSITDLLIKVIKVSTTTKSPDGSGASIPISGVLLVPRFNNIFSLQILVALPSTYTHNEDAPSNVFKTLSPTKANGDINFLYFLTLHVPQGFAVLFPDYPGFGDSYQKTTMPFLTKQPLVTSTIDLVKASQETLKKNRYSYKKELFITGYSLGGYVATALAKELDKNKDLPAKLTVAGGAPLNLNELMSYAQSAESLPASYVYPYTLLSYDVNENASSAISDILKAPYDKAYLANAFNGTRYGDEVGNMFPSKPSELFTEESITQFNTNPKFAIIRSLMSKNSVEPWKNSNKLVLIHGMADNLVYYESTYNFFKKQKSLGGNITFVPSASQFADHFSGIIDYYTGLVEWLSNYHKY